MIAVVNVIAGRSVLRPYEASSVGDLAHLFVIAGRSVLRPYEASSVGDLAHLFSRPMTLRLGPGDYRDMPWKNGGGVTREIVKLPHPSGPDRFLARLSIATIARSGPFSLFAGVDRTLLLLEGEGVALSFGEGPEVVLDRRLRPVCFPGEAPVHSRLLGGPVRDFNLMVDRQLGSATLRVVSLVPGGSSLVAPDGDALLFVVSGQARAGGEGLGAEELLVLEKPGPLSLESERGAQVIVVSLARHEAGG